MELNLKTLAGVVLINTILWLMYFLEPSSHDETVNMYTVSTFSLVTLLSLFEGYKLRINRIYVVLVSLVVLFAICVFLNFDIDVTSSVAATLIYLMFACSYIFEV